MRLRTTLTLAAAAVLVLHTAAVTAAVNPYSQDFESLVQTDPNALADDGWIVYGNVFSPDGGTWYYGYGPFPAPNGGPAFCAIATGEGGPAQGAQQLSVYSDYNNGDHANGNLIETNVYREQTIEASDVGRIVTFTFDAKLGNLEGASQAEAFIKTLDPAAGWATTNHVVQDTTTIPATWGTYSIQLTIDSSLVGQVLQFGFTTRATNYEGSGVFYDNINVQVAAPTPTPPPGPGSGTPVPATTGWGAAAMAAFLIAFALLILTRRR